MTDKTPPLSVYQPAEVQKYYRLPDIIKTREPPAWSTRRYSRCRNAICNWTSYDVLNLYKRIFGKGPKSYLKADVIEEAARLLEFKTKDDFDAWFAQFSPSLRRLIAGAVFYEYFPAEAIAMLFPGEAVLVRKKKEYYSREKFSFTPAYTTEFLDLYERDDNHVFVSISPLLRELLAPHLEPPFGGRLDDCVFEPPEAQDNAAAPQTPWSGESSIGDSWPLFTEALAAFSRGTVDEKLIRTFPKALCKELYTSSGLTPFPRIPGGGEDTPDRASLAARFALCMSDLRPVRTVADGPEGIKKLITRFFLEESQAKNKWQQYDRHFFEYYTFCEHLTRRTGVMYNTDTAIPPSRKTLGWILREIAQDGRTFDANLLADYLCFSGQPFTIDAKGEYERFLKIRARHLTLNGLGFVNPDYINDFPADRCFRFELFARPLFLAYLWLFAALGLLEITLRWPPTRLVTTAGKRKPLSAYDSLESVKVTELGRWCLGVSDRKPVQEKGLYEAIADKELFLVTVAGRSLQHRIFLDKVGDRLGEQPGEREDPGEYGRRWRISYASFLSGCESHTELELRIARFNVLIDGSSAPHWQTFFMNLRRRAGVFDNTGEEALLYSLPQNRELAEELLADPALKTVARRAEGRCLAVSSKDQKRFRAFLASHGILSSSPAK